MSLPLSTIALPLFPLRTVLMPGGVLSLRIFEPRYLDLVKRCARNGEGFGVCLIEDGHEAGAPARPTRVGTEARIVDFAMREDGLLGIAVEGERRFRLCTTSTQADGLVVAEALWLAAPPRLRVRPEHSFLVDLLKRMLERAGGAHAHAEPASFDDSDWVSCRLAELLPLALDQRQHLLEESDTAARLDALLRWLPLLA
ncbi:MAG: LON peptidase substrate-binding domain-containing protein [Lysobacteraceae bacterium]